MKLELEIDTKNEGPHSLTWKLMGVMMKWTRAEPARQEMAPLAHLQKVTNEETLADKDKHD